jgi:hypothetical protein
VEFVTSLTKDIAEPTGLRRLDAVCTWRAWRLAGFEDRTICSG